MTTIGSLTNNPASVDTLSTHPLVVSTERVGIEVELEGIDSRNWNSDYWNSIPDGSLRNNGIEYVTRGRGLGGKDLFQAITQLDSYLHEVTPDGSWRCSTHVHLDVRNMTVHQVKLLTLIYAVHERLLFKCSGWHRYKNNFCIALGAGQTQIKHLSKVWHLNDSDFIRTLCQQWNKYTAINFVPMTSLGTVEFRMSEAKWRKGHLVKLVNRFLSMKQLAMTWEGTEQELIQHLSTLEPRVLFRKGLPREVDLLREDTDLGMKFAGDIRNTAALLRKQITREMGERMSMDSADRVFEVINNDQVAGIGEQWFVDNNLNHLYPMGGGLMITYEEADQLRSAGVRLSRLLGEQSALRWSALREQRNGRDRDRPRRSVPTSFSFSSSSF